mmetsp:Transcript_4341/g.4853  ORF Transcript_4341/g.4853 Transcript_4341/m.4853 type:complete len:237 (-) Transcript_4341:313-1023(-)
MLASYLLLLLGRLGGLSVSFLLLDTLDDTDGDGLSHISDGESTERSILGEDLNTHGLVGDQSNHSGITSLDELGGFFQSLSGSSVNLLVDGFEFAGNMGSMAIQNGSITVGDLSGMVHDDNLSVERGTFLGGVVLGVRANISSLDILDGDILAIESDIVSGLSFRQGFVMHFDGLDFSGETVRGEGNNHTGLQETSFDSTDGDSSDTGDLVDILQGQSKRLVNRSLGGSQVVQSTQ